MRKYEIIQKTLRGVSTFFLNPVKAVKFVRKCQRNGIRDTLSHYLKNNLTSYENEFNSKLRKFSILTPLHSMPLALMLKDSLYKVGLACEVTSNEEEFASISKNTIPIVLAPQIFKKLPTQFIAFQLEQKESSWFNSEYFDLLKNATFVFEFAENNLNYLLERGISFSRLYYLPITPSNFLFSKSIHQVSCKYDLVFYGCLNERRKKILEELKKHFSVLVVTDCFGEDLHKKLYSAKLVINIHYYPNAELESTRLIEALGLGLSVVSEDTQSKEDLFFKDVVTFAKKDDIGDLITKIKESLKNKDSTNSESLVSQFSWFEFYLFRFLLSQDIIDFQCFMDKFISNFPVENNKICLSLPESVERRQNFLRQPEGQSYSFFPGLRHSLGWVGCGMSYKFMYSLYKHQSYKLLHICEDDVVFASDFQVRLNIIERYLSNNNNWQVYCGLISDVNKSLKLKSHFLIDGEELLLLNHAVGLVYTIYSPKALDLLSRWDISQLDVQKNTIDRYMESNLSDFLVSIPFLVEQDPDLTSTLWKQENSKIYSEAIQSAEKELKGLVHSNV